QLKPKDLTVVAGAAHVEEASDGSVVLEQAKSSTSVVSAVGPKASSPHRLGATEQKLKLPWWVVDAQAVNTESVVRSARPFLKLARAVQWDPEKKLHIAEVLIGLDAESGAGGALAEPLIASLAVSCDSVEPQSVRFTTIGSAGDQLVRVACSPKVKNERAEQSISLRLQGAELDYAFEIPRRPGPFELQASTNSVLGMGLGELTLTAVQREEDGTPLVAREPMTVSLHASDGEITPDSLVIAAGSAQGIATVHVRGHGELQVIAGSAERESMPVPLRVRWPFLLASMAPVGGALGGFMAVRWQRKQPARKPLRRRQHVMAVIEGAVVGTVVVLTLMLVPDVGLVPSWARTAEAAWFVAAVFAGFLGLELLDRIARLFFRQQPNAKEVPPTRSALEADGGSDAGE
ncbi:MAG TPA: hypothetical protein VMF89_24405, partial [Polyangiales bacterium]|nr:hypothetical protein [Polyangiales bacterium]